MNNIEVRYLTPNDEYELIQFISSDEEPDTAGIQTEKEVWTKELVSVSGVPEVKMETCHRRVRIRYDGSVNVPYPCAYTRTSRHWMELRVKYPSDSTQEAKEKVTKCALEGAIAAAAVIAVGVAAPEAIPALIPSAKAAFAAKFAECLEEEIRNSVDFEITHESEAGEWSRV